MSLIRLNRHPSRRDLRIFGTLGLLVFATLGAIAWRQGAELAALVAWATSLALGGPGLVYPPLLRPLYLVAIFVTFPIGLVVSYVLLGALYFLVLTPIGLLMRLLGRDPLQRRFEPNRKSYWLPRSHERPATSYFHQH
jgi:hypothetical protein